MGIILGIATLLGGLAAVWFFWDKLVDLFKRKPNQTEGSSKPTEDIILRTIQNSSPSEWTYYDPKAIYTFKMDVNLNIKRHPTDSQSQFPEKWAHKFPDPSAHSVKFTIYYGDVPIKDFLRSRWMVAGAISLFQSQLIFLRLATGNIILAK